MEAEQQILQKLDKIEREVVDIKKHMIDIDSILTEDDLYALIAYRKEKAAGTLLSHARLKKKLGL